MPRTVRDRELEELGELTLLRLAGLDDPPETKWKLTNKASELLEAAGLRAGLDSGVPIRSGSVIASSCPKESEGKEIEISERK